MAAAPAGRMAGGILDKLRGRSAPARAVAPYGREHLGHRAGHVRPRLCGVERRMLEVLGHEMAAPRSDSSTPRSHAAASSTAPAHRRASVECTRIEAPE